MGIEYQSVVDHPLDEVFGWHTRPGAMTRLVPPWQPMRVVAETQSLADGRAVLSLPGGLRWVAQHDPSGFDPPHRFVDELSSQGFTSWPARIIGWWRHTHEFSEAPGGTRGARELAEANQRVVPTKLETLGHRFRRSTLTDALAHELGHG
jgi:hypothetical protein